MYFQGRPGVEVARVPEEVGRPHGPPGRPAPDHPQPFRSTWAPVSPSLFPVGSSARLVSPAMPRFGQPAGDLAKPGTPVDFALWAVALGIVGLSAILMPGG